MGAIGDICMLLPIVDSLSQHYEVDWLIRRSHAPLLRCFPRVACRPIPVDDGVADGDMPFAPDLVARLSAEGYAGLIDFSHWPSVRWLAGRLGGIPVRAVTVDPVQDALLGVPSAPPETDDFNVRVAAPDGIHQCDKWLRLVRAACRIDLAVSWPLPARPPPTAGRPLRMMVHAHAGKPEKVWPAARFARAIAELARHRRVECYVNKVGQRTMRTLRWRLLLAGVRMHTVPQDPTFRALHDTLRHCDLAFGCDSGPMHFAANLGVPTVVVYGRYPAAEFGPRWRSTPVSPAEPGADAGAVPVERASAALHRVAAQLESGLPEERGEFR
jgi:ADP-heptose:LPS heptosyltransferase